MRPHRRQPTRLPHPWDSPGKNTEWVAISFSNAWKWKVKVKSLSRVRLFTTPWTAAYQAPPSMGFSRQEYWSGVPLPSPHKVTILAQSDYCKKKYHILGDLEYKYLFLTVRRLESPRSRCWQIWCLERTCFLVHTLFFSLSPYTVEGARALSGVTFTSALIPFMRAPLSWPHHLPKAPSPHNITLGLRFQHMNLVGDTNIPLITFWPLKLHVLLACKIHSFHPNSSRSLNWIQS